MVIDFRNLTKIMNTVYFPSFKYKGRFLVLYGGSGSGKSYFAGQKLVYRVLAEKGHRILCCRKTAASTSKSQFPLLVNTIESWGVGKFFKINNAPGKERITCLLNGNEIMFCGLDDTEKLKSIFDITSIWVEEASEILPEDFRELNRRLRGYQGKGKYMQIIFSFNPISALHWLKQYFFDTEQPDSLVLHTTYKDNRFIDDVYKDQLEKLATEDPYEHTVYALGQWGTPGGIFFAGEQLTNRIVQLKNTRNRYMRRGYFEFEDTGRELKHIRFVDDPGGAVTIYKEPIPGFPYVIGGDTAGEGSDWNVAQMVDNITGEQVAVIRQQYDEDLFAKQEMCLGYMFNTALIGNEMNFSTHPTKVLESYGYPRHYVREQAPDAYTGRLGDRFGWNTNKITRMNMLGTLRSVVREQVTLINDLTTLEEMTTFIKNEQGKPEAADGFHDDCVLSLAIAWAIRGQQSSAMSGLKQVNVSHLPEDVQRDYYDASPEQQRSMLRKWGLLKDEEDERDALPAN